MKNRRAGGDEDFILDNTSDQMGIGTHETMVADAAALRRRASDHRVFQDDAVGSDFNRTALGHNTGAEHDAAVGVTTDDNSREDQAALDLDGTIRC